MSYFKLPDDLTSDGTPGTKKKKHKRHVPTRQLVHTPSTSETSETEQLLQDYLHAEFGDSGTVNHNGQYGGQDSYNVRGHRVFCPCCEDSHKKNGVYITHNGGMFFKYK